MQNLVDSPSGKGRAINFQVSVSISPKAKSPKVKAMKEDHFRKKINLNIHKL